MMILLWIFCHKLNRNIMAKMACYIILWHSVFYVYFIEVDRYLAEKPLTE